MTIYSIVRGTGYLAATQVLHIPKSLFAVKIRSCVPNILHPLVLWTQVVPPLEYGALVCSTLCGDKAEVSFGPEFQKIQFTSDVHIPLEIGIHSDFKNLISVSRVYHLYALGDECVERIYNGKYAQHLGMQNPTPLSASVKITDVEEPRKLK